MDRVRPDYGNGHQTIDQITTYRIKIHQTGSDSGIPVEHGIVLLYKCLSDLIVIGVHVCCRNGSCFREEREEGEDRVNNQTAFRVSGSRVDQEHRRGSSLTLLSYSSLIPDFRPNLQKVLAAGFPPAFTLV